MFLYIYIYRNAPSRMSRAALWFRNESWQGDGKGEALHRIPICSALGFETMTENVPAHICSHLATACSPGCFSRRVWSVLAEESLQFPKHAYHFVLDNDGNLQHFFFFFGGEANMSSPALAGSIVLLFLCAGSRRTDKVSPKYCWLCRCQTWESWVEGGGE